MPVPRHRKQIDVSSRSIELDLHLRLRPRRHGLVLGTSIHSERRKLCRAETVILVDGINRVRGHAVPLLFIACKTGQNIRMLDNCTRFYLAAPC